MTLYGDSQLGLQSFFSTNTLISHGPPSSTAIVPASVNIVGLFEKLKRLTHPNICQYVDIKRGKQNRMLVVTEYYAKNLSQPDFATFGDNPAKRKQLATSIIRALTYLNSNNIVSRNLTSKNICVSKYGELKVANFGIYHATNNGEYVRFPIGDPAYLPPELFKAGPSSNKACQFNVDVWSLGIILVEIILGRCLWSDLPRKTRLRKLIERVLNLNNNKHGTSLLQFLLESHQALPIFFTLDEDQIDFIDKCLIIDSNKRPEAKDLMYHSYIHDVILIVPPYLPLIPTCFEKETGRASSLDTSAFIFSSFMTDSNCLANGDSVKDGFNELLKERRISDVYYLWSLAGGDLMQELTNQGMVQSKAPISSMPAVVTNFKERFGQEKETLLLYSDITIPLCMDKLEERLQHLAIPDFYPLLLLTDNNSNDDATKRIADMAKLPHSIRETDIEYQFHRMVIFQRYLESYPYKRDEIIQESTKDICPLQRANIWAAILGVEADYTTVYEAIDKTSEQTIDRQIEVDIPRCHQYNELLASIEGHAKLKRVIKGWLETKNELVYWQGLDSIAAAFLVINFNNEAMAYACMHKFIDKYVHNFFYHNNSPVMQEYLVIFSQLIAHLDPKLSNHLQDIAFFPELYAIPWFLTVFTHIFPLQKVLKLWNIIMVHDHSFPLFIGLSILAQLRSNLLEFGFNECILLFSDLPDINIDKCITYAIHAHKVTPQTATLRQYSVESVNYNDPKPIPGKESQTLDQLREVKCVTITAKNFHSLYKAHRKALTTNKKENQHSLLIIDIDSTAEFKNESIPSSYNMPVNSTFDEKGNFVNANCANIIFEKGTTKTKVVVGNDTKSAHNFAESLQKLGVVYVCVLFGGKSSVNKLGILSTTL